MLFTTVVNGQTNSDKVVIRPDNSSNLNYLKNNDIHSYSPLINNSKSIPIVNKKFYWGIEVDLDKMRKKHIKDIIARIPMVDSFAFFNYEKMPSKVSALQMYSVNGVDSNVLLRGDFDGFSAKDFYIKFLSKSYNVDKLLMGKSEKFLEGTIEVYKIPNTAKKYKQKLRKLYVGQLNNLIAYSFDVKEVKFWMSHPSLPLLSLSDKPNQDMFFQYKLNGRFLLDEDEMHKGGYQYKSNIFRRSKSLYFIMSENNSQLFFGALISAKTPAVAKQIADVLDGLIAINNLSEQNSSHVLKRKMFEKSLIIQEGSLVRIGTTLSRDDVLKFGHLAKK